MEPRRAGAESLAGDRRAARVSGLLLASLAFVLPFEAPLVRVGPLLLTTVEVVLYVTIAAFGVVVLGRLHRGAARPGLAILRSDPVLAAALAYLLVLALSAAHAPALRGPAVKFVFRSTSGVLAFVAARSLARDRRTERWVVLALVAGAALSAVSALAQALVPASEPLWKVFREGGIVALGLPRASGVFGYPTIAAMYWEAALPLVCVVPMVLGPGRAEGKRARLVVFSIALIAAILVAALFTTASRAGLAGAAAVCALVAVLGWAQDSHEARLGARLAALAAGLLVASAALSLVSTGPGALFGQRLRFWQDDRWFGVEYLVDTPPRTIHANDRFRVPVTLRNTGTIPWPHGGDHPTHLAYHWERDDGPTTNADYEGRRTALSADVAPGGVLEVVATVRAPDVPGSYRLLWDLVQEDVTWFGDQGNPTPEEPFDVQTGRDGESAYALDDTPPPMVAPAPPSRPSLWRAAAALWRGQPLLGVGPDNFRRLYTTVLPVSPDGKPYRDARLHANSLYAETLADEGLLGVLALGALVWALVRTLRGAHAGGAGSGVGLAAGLGALAFFVHGVVDYFFEFTPVMGLFWVLLGLSSASRRERPVGGAAP